MSCTKIVTSLFILTMLVSGYFPGINQLAWVQDAQQDEPRQGVPGGRVGGGSRAF
ncbi:MAG: hypothetical protein F6K42_07020 [Leptolyngbya sp. SIO1D8]|nr:hypothetical protein [Leptolyngbya sp. SIO1D8]